MILRLVNMNEKTYGRRHLWPNLSYCPVIRLERLSLTTKIKDLLGWYFKLIPPKYETGMMFTLSWRWTELCISNIYTQPNCMTEQYLTCNIQQVWTVPGSHTESFYSYERASTKFEKLNSFSCMRNECSLHRECAKSNRTTSTSTSTSQVRPPWSRISAIFLSPPPQKIIKHCLQIVNDWFLPHHSQLTVILPSDIVGQPSQMINLC